MKKLLLALPMVLSGCLSIKGLGITGASTGGAVLGTAVAGPGAGAVLGIGAGLAADATIPEPVQNVDNFRGDDGVFSFTELLAYMWANFTTHMITIGIVAFLFWLVSSYLTARMPRGEERLMKKMMEKDK